MGTVSVSLPSDGQTIDAADYNTPINTIVTAVNGNLDSDNIAEGGVVPNSLTDGTGTSWAWQDWTPTKTNITVGSGTETAKYIQVGKTVHFRYKFTLGAGSAIGSSPTITLPVAASANYNADIGSIVGRCTFLDAGNEIYSGVLVFSSGSAYIFRTSTASSTYVGNAPVTATVPFTWGSADVLMVTGTYEAA